MKLLVERVCADFVYIDGSHKAADVLADLVISFELTKVGGVVICDDYVWRGESIEEVDILNNPKLAIDSFTNIYRNKLALIVDVPLRQFGFVRRS